MNTPSIALMSLTMLRLLGTALASLTMPHPSPSTWVASLPCLILKSGSGSHLKTSASSPLHRLPALSSLWSFSQQMSPSAARSLQPSLSMVLWPGETCMWFLNCLPLSLAWSGSLLNTELTAPSFRASSLSASGLSLAFGLSLITPRGSPSLLITPNKGTPELEQESWANCPVTWCHVK